MKKALEYRAAELREEMETHEQSLVHEDIRASLERRLRRAEREAEQIRPGPRGHGPAYYAEVYLAALQTSRTPTKAVADHFGVASSTANKLVERSRHHYGFIPPASQGKATGLSQAPTRRRRGGRDEGTDHRSGQRAGRKGRRTSWAYVIDLPPLRGKRRFARQVGGFSTKKSCQATRAADLTQLGKGRDPFSTTSHSRLT